MPLLPGLPTVDGSSAFLPGCTLSCPPSCSGAQNLMGCPGLMPLMLPSFPTPLLLFRSYSLNVCNLKLSYLNNLLIRAIAVTKDYCTVRVL